MTTKQKCFLILSPYGGYFHDLQKTSNFSLDSSFSFISKLHSFISLFALEVNYQFVFHLLMNKLMFQ